MPTTYCRHIKTNGRRCCSVALRDKAFCYYHINVNAHRRAIATHSQEPTIIHPLNTDENRQRNPIYAEYFGPKPGPLALDFPALEDRDSIQVALSMLITAMGKGSIEPKRATPILYGLQVASANAARIRTSEDRHNVTEVVTDEEGNQLALDEDPTEIVEFNQFLSDIDEEEEDEDDEYADEEDED